MNPFKESLIDSRFSIDLPHFLASQREYIYVQMNFDWMLSNAGDPNPLSNAGSAASFADWWPAAEPIVHRLQLKVIEQLLTSLPKINRQKVAMIGFGSGAFTALHTIIADEKRKYLNGVIAVAPIVNWRLMGTIVVFFFFIFNLNQIKSNQMKSKRIIIVDFRIKTEQTPSAPSTTLEVL
jgi:hypothetical protein